MLFRWLFNLTIQRYGFLFNLPNFINFFIFINVKDLIKKILKEYTETKVTIRVVGNVGNNINESHFKPEIPKEIYSLINDRVKNINPFYGEFIDKKTGELNKVEFFIQPTKHYIDRLFRTSDPEHQPGGKKYNPRIVDPSPLEGIEMLINNKDRLAQEILTKRINDRDEVEVVAIDGSKLNLIVIFDYENKIKNVPKYTLYLKNQIKGDRFFQNKNQKNLKLYPNP